MATADDTYMENQIERNCVSNCVIPLTRTAKDGENIVPPPSFSLSRRNPTAAWKLIQRAEAETIFTKEGQNTR